MKSASRAVWPILALSALSAACGVMSKKQDHIQDRTAFDERHSSGCVQGVVINGQTGERIALSGKQADEGIFVLAHSSHLGAVPADNADYLKGEFVLCGVPLDESFPIFARFHGFGEFYSNVQIESTLAQKSPKASVDIRKPEPTRIANIRLYPIGIETQDLKFQVVHNGAPVEAATVRLTPQGRSFFDDAAFLAPLNFRSQPVVMKTDAKGEVIFSKDSLMLGGVYNYDVLPPQGGLFQEAQAGSITVGLGNTGVNQPDPYSVVVNLSDSRASDLVLVSSSLDDADYDSRGRISLVFNRAIKLAPGTEDKQTAFLTNAVTARIRDTVANNGAAEQVNAYVDGNTVTLEPIFSVIPDAATEAGLEVTFSGIEIQVADGPNNTVRKDLGSLTVKLFGGTTQPIPFKYADTLELTGGNGQAAQITAALASPLKVRVYDQFGAPFSGQKVSFQIDGANSGGSLSSYLLVTDASGYATTNWTLGNTVGKQSVLVTAVSIRGDALKNSPQSFTATAADKLVATTMAVAAGDAQTAKAGTQLAADVQVKVLDQNGAPIAGQNVIFELTQASGGGSLTSFVIASDANGLATTKWTLGSTVGAQQVTVRAVNARGVTIGNLTVSATATAP